MEGVSLSCNEGTRLVALAQAALDATKVLLESLPPNTAFRPLYVLNTDGESSDGVKAGIAFVEGYNLLREQFPHMAEARTFVLGIGSHHDQKVHSPPLAMCC